MVIVLENLLEFNKYRAQEKLDIGFVPTMGNLHAGHISLLEAALKDFSKVYFSIFVNPKQFGPNEDYTKYPRTLEDDLEKIQALVQKHPNKEVVVFAPTDPSEVFAKSLDQNISVEEMKDIIEGEHRPGHFDGVATVVYRLFELVKPKKAYFGLKDYQQFLVIKRMVQELQLPIDIIGMPIIREASGLALSSRNQYLSPEETLEALTLSEGLKKVSHYVQENLNKAQEMRNELLKDPKWNYLEIRDAQTLSRDILNSKKIVILGVYQLRKTRLLDNIEVELA